jgi:hypothetical protein
MKSIKKIFKNRKEILEGIKNRVFKKEHIEVVAKERWESNCVKCDSLDRIGSICTVAGTQPCCGECGCSLALKLRSLSSSCPLDKWNAVLTEEEEDKLNKTIENEETKSK